MTQRFKLPPGGDVPPMTAARRLAMTLEAFREKLPRLLCRGFPAPDPDTGNFDLDAIDQWRRTRNPHLFHTQLTPPSTARDAKDVVRQRIEGMRGG